MVFELIPPPSPLPRTLGLPYRGSKSRIAQWVIGHLPSAPMLVDVFAGGCAVSQAALLTGRWETVWANDILDGPDFFRAVALGDDDGIRVASRDEFKQGDLLTRLIYSFNYNMKDYIFNQKNEERALAETRKIVAQPDIVAAYRRRQEEWKREFLATNETADRSRYLCNVESMMRIQKLRTMKPYMPRFIPSALDYRTLDIPEDAIAYADPPYWGTVQYGFKFESDLFWNWAREQKALTVVSEYAAPDDFVEVASIPMKSMAGKGGDTRDAVEKLFVHETRVDEWWMRIDDVWTPVVK